MRSFCSKKKHVVQIFCKNSNDAAKTAFMNTLHRETFCIFLNPTHDGAKQTEEKTEINWGWKLRLIQTIIAKEKGNSPYSFHMSIIQIKTHLH